MQKESFFGALGVNLLKESLYASHTNIEGIGLQEEQCYSFVIFGASGHLANNKIYPTLYSLYKNELLPDKVHIFGYARSRLTVADIKEKTERNIREKLKDVSSLKKFWELNHYTIGEYKSETDFLGLIEEMEKIWEGLDNRIYYLSLPPLVYESISWLVKKLGMSKQGWTRVIFEKPFGKDSRSARILSEHAANLFSEDQIYRIDHYLGKEMVQNLMIVKFGNRVFSPVWNRDNIASVKITFKERIGIEGRGGYFEEYGIIRDVMQNHLLQILTLIAMEKPVSLKNDHIRDEKVKVLKSTKDISIEDVMIGQYVGNPSGDGDQKIGYRDDPTIANDSLVATYAVAVVKICNERWDDVPFILECGKALDEQVGEVRIQFKDVPGDIFEGKPKRNEFIIKIQPGEAILLHLMVKTPSISFDMEPNVLDMTYAHRYGDVRLPEAYERLILDIFCGSQINFVRSDEMEEAWRIFTPILHQIDCARMVPLSYVRGSSGPKQVEKIYAKYNFIP